MAVSQIQKINLISDQKYQGEILEILQDLGVAQIDKIKNDELRQAENLSEKISALDYQIANTKFALDFLDRYQLEKTNFLDKILNPKITLGKTKFQRVIQKFDWQEVVRQTQEVENQINLARGENEKLQQEKNQLDPWTALTFNLAEESATVNFLLTIVNENVFENFIKELADKVKLSTVQKIDWEEKKVRVAIIFDKKAKKEVEAVLAKFNLKTAELPKLKESVAERLKEIEQQITENSQLIKKLQTKAGQLAQAIERLKIIYDHLFWEKQKLEQVAKFANTNSTFIINAFVPTDAINKIEKAIEKVTKNFVVIAVPTAAGENLPVMLANKIAFSPFEMVTGIYGAPGYTDPDPTPFLAPFFIFFFGVCLTDAGYGLILFALSLLALKFLKPKGGMAKLFKILAIGGGVTFVLGALFGGWFGIVLDKLPPSAVGDLLLKIRIIDPSAEPIKMLLFVLGLGVIQLLFGLIVKAWWKIKNGQIIEALLGPLAWFYFLSSVLTWALLKNTPGIFGLVIKYNLWLIIIFMIITQGRGTKNIVVRLGKGVLSLYGIVSYVADVLSYSRLLALGLATGIIAMVINLIAFLFKDMIPYVGWLVMIIVLLGGHLFNIVINTLGAFIHSGRLQFVEFFPKFLEGSGSIFKPFVKESRYVNVIEKNLENK